MRKYSDKEVKLINIQIGCILRLARLKKELSQHSLSLLLGSNPTMIGRIERFENVCGWDKILFISQHLDVDFCSLFILKSKDHLLSIIEESFLIEDKLTDEKRDFYRNLKKTVIDAYDFL